MGFASGTQAINTIWEELKKKKLVPTDKKKKQQMAEILVSAFEDLDTDDWDYEEGSVFDTARPEEAASARDDEADGRVIDDEEDEDYDDDDLEPPYDPFSEDDE